MSGDIGVVDNQGWITMWSVGDTGFHQSTHDRFLDENKEQYFEGEKSIFLPLCGKSFDLLWMYKHGHTVCGVEIAEQAVQEFFQENNIEFQVEDVENVGKLYQSKDGRLKLYVADMFKMSPKVCGQFDIIFDSKAFVAINIPERQKYVDVVLSLLKEDGRYYLGAMEFDYGVWRGPPHTSPPEVIKSSYSERCNIEILDKDDQFIKERTSSTSGEEPQPKKQCETLMLAFEASSYVMVRWYKMTLKPK